MVEVLGGCGGVFFFGLGVCFSTRGEGRGKSPIFRRDWHKGLRKRGVGRVRRISNTSRGALVNGSVFFPRKPVRERKRKRYIGITHLWDSCWGIISFRTEREQKSFIHEQMKRGLATIRGKNNNKNEKNLKFTQKRGVTKRKFKKGRFP